MLPHRALVPISLRFSNEPMSVRIRAECASVARCPGTPGAPRRTSVVLALSGPVVPTHRTRPDAIGQGRRIAPTLQTERRAER